MPRSARKTHGLRQFSPGRFTAAVVIVLVAGWLCSVLCVVGFATYDGAVPQDGAPPADAIVVLGAAQYSGRPSPVLRARIDHALELWQARAGLSLVFTGGTGRGDTTSEAVVGSVYARRHGVPDQAIVLESAGRTTSESMHAVALLLQARGERSVVLVSDPFHMFRLWILAHRVGLLVRTSPTRTSPIAASIGSNAGYIFSESVKAPIAFLIE